MLFAWEGEGEPLGGNIITKGGTIALVDYF